MPHHATVYPMGDVVPHAVALDADSYGVSTRRSVYGDTWHEGADASRGHRWDERHDSTPLLLGFLRWLRPRHVVRRAGLLWHVTQSLSILLPLLPCRTCRNWSVRE